MLLGLWMESKNSASDVQTKQMWKNCPDLEAPNFSRCSYTVDQVPQSKVDQPCYRLIIPVLTAFFSCVVKGVLNFYYRTHYRNNSDTDKKGQLLWEVKIFHLLRIYLDRSSSRDPVSSRIPATLHMDCHLPPHRSKA